MEATSSRLAEAADGLAGAQLGAGFFLVVLVEFLEIALDEGRLHGAGADGVDAQSLGVFDGELARHGDDGALGGAVGEALLDADQARDRSDVDDGAGATWCCSCCGGEKQRQERRG